MMPKPRDGIRVSERFSHLDGGMLGLEEIVEVWFVTYETTSGELVERREER